MINDQSIQQALCCSLMILGVYIAFVQGMIFGWLRIAVANRMDKLAGKRWSRILQKPLWDCYPCMGGIWTIILTWSFDLRMILLVVGLNLLIENTIFEGGLPEKL